MTCDTALNNRSTILLSVQLIKRPQGSCIPVTYWCSAHHVIDRNWDWFNTEKDDKLWPKGLHDCSFGEPCSTIGSQH